MPTTAGHAQKNSSTKSQELSLTSGQNLLNLLSPIKSEQSQNSIYKIIEVDTRSLNFGTFYPAKIFKCALHIENISDSKRIISFKFDANLLDFSETYLENEFSMSIGPKQITGIVGKSQKTANTEHLYKCWYLMQPPSKSFEKTLTITLNPKQKIEIGVVIKSPQVLHYEKFCSVLYISLAENDSLFEKVKDKISVFNIAEVDIPKLECTKEMIYTQNNIRVVPLVAKFEDSDIQKLKIPFKNNGDQDLDLQLSILQYPGASESKLVNFACAPNTCKIPARNIGIICINAMKKENNSDGEQTEWKLCERQQKVLMCKLKNTQMLYYFVLDITSID